jgi:4,5-dihydroxyphthalate decarboxylase
LKGKRVGLPEYQLTANVWVRLFLREDYGVRPEDITWVRGGYEQPGRIEKITLNLPAGVRLENAPAGETLSKMLARGDLDAVIGPRAPSCYQRGEPNVGYLFPNPQAAATEWFQRTRIFPIMHLLGIRRELAEAHPWLPYAVVKAFSEAKDRALEHLTDTSATKVTLPFVEEQLEAARRLIGPDFWSYGLETNRHVLEAFLREHHAEGLSARLLKPEELFHPAALEAHKI